MNILPQAGNFVEFCLDLEEKSRRFWGWLADYRHCE
jgi:hypothetical protein